MGELLQPGACAHGLATCGGSPAGTAAHDIDHIAVVQADDDVRGCPPARRQCLSPQVPARPPLWAAVGAPFRVLPAVYRGDRPEGLALLGGLSKGEVDFTGSPYGARSVDLYGSLDHTRRRG